MPGFPLSPELCKRIVQWSSPRPGVLGALCLTCKSLQREAEIKLYESLIFVDTRVAYLAFRTISSHERFGLYVRHLVFDPRPQSPAISTSFWGTFQVALSRMDNLEFFSISDTTYSNSWILDTAKFQLRELKVGFCWDESFLCFLKTQQKLRFLSFFDQFDDRSRLRIPSPCLPSLQMYEGSLMTAAQLVSSPITHMQIVVDRDVMPLLIATLPRLSKLHTTLRSLSILEVPEELSAKMLSIISRACPLVRYLGLLRLPTHNRHKIHHSLMHMHYLCCMDIDITRWHPQPGLAAQRSLAAELRMYCPTLAVINFWVGTTRYRWTYLNEWQSRAEHNQFLHFHNLWRTMP